MISDTVAVAIISGMGSLALGAFGVLKVWIPVASKRSSKSVERGLGAISRGYRLMKTLTSDRVGANRVTLFSAHNSGGVPRFGKAFYVSKVHYEVSDGVETPLNYTNIKVDSHYVRMLESVMSDDYYEFITENEAPCQLRDFYLAEGIVESRIYMLGIQDNQFIYMSVATSEIDGVHTPMTHNQKTLEKLIVNDIRNSMILV